MCQMYLQAVTLTKTTEGRGTQITTYTAKGKEISHKQAYGNGLAFPTLWQQPGPNGEGQ